jgi:hypothetical protein
MFRFATGLMRLSQNSDSPGGVAQTFFRTPCGDGPLARRKSRSRYALTLKVQ